MLTYFHYMKNCFNFKGKASRSEFWLCALSFAFIGGFLWICEALIWILAFDVSPDIVSQITISGMFGIIAFYSLSARRLRDAGYSEKVLRWIIFPFGPPIALFVSFLPSKYHINK